MPSQRLIRHQTIWQRLSSYPQDLLLSLNESYELLEWDSLSDTLSIPMGITVNVIYVLARLDQLDYTSSYREKDVFEGARIRDSGGIFTGNNSGIHTLVFTSVDRADFSCTFFRGFWWDLVLRMHCIVLRRERIIACLIQRQMYLLLEP